MVVKNETIVVKKDGGYVYIIAKGFRFLDVKNVLAVGSLLTNIDRGWKM